jgi:hypothetical protein
MAQDIPNSVLGKFLSLEMLGMVVVVAISWGVVTTKVSGLEREYEKSKSVQLAVDREQGQETRAIRDEVGLINRKVDVLGNNQEHFKDQIERVDDRLDLILDILEKKDVKE